MIKLGVVIGFYICAINAYRKRSGGRWTGIPIVFTIYIAVLIGLLILDLTQ